MARRAGALIGLAVLWAGLALAGGGAALAQQIGSYAAVDVRALNLRAAPDPRARVIRTLPRGTVVSILDRRGGWARIFVQDGGDVEGWLAARFLRRSAHGGGAGQGHGHHHARPAPLRVSKLDFDCRAPLFGDSGIRKCVASARVQLAHGAYDPARAGSVPIVCRGQISYRTRDGASARMFAYDRGSIAYDDRLGQSMRINFDVRAIKAKIDSAHLTAFYCAQG